MPLTITDFKNVANSAFFTSRDIKLDGAGANVTARLGNYIFSAGKKANDAVMSAFKEALEKEYGSLGTHAFDTIVGSRNQLHKSLRACDVKATLSNLETIRKHRFIGEVNRQLDTNPKMLELSDEMQLAVRKNIADNALKGRNLSDYKTPTDVARAVSNLIDEAIRDVQEYSDNNLEGASLDTAKHAVGGGVADARAARGDEPVGLKNLNTDFTKDTPPWRTGSSPGALAPA